MQTPLSYIEVRSCKKNISYTTYAIDLMHINNSYRKKGKKGRFY